MQNDQLIPVVGDELYEVEGGGGITEIDIRLPGGGGATVKRDPDAAERSREGRERRRRERRNRREERRRRRRNR